MPSSTPYELRVADAPADVDAAAWDALLATQPQATPFLRHAYLAALHDSGSATPQTGWTPLFFTLWRGDALQAACALYVKPHSYGEYVFDFAWADAYARHGLDYYPKAVVAVPFTPVPGARLLARDAASRTALLRALVAWCGEAELSSLHLLFGADADVEAAREAGLMLRHTVQFHWKNVAPTLPAARGSLPPEGAPPALGRPGGGLDAAPTLPAAQASPADDAGPPALAPHGDEGSAGRPFHDFDDFLASLAQDKRKKIRQERRKVAEAGVTFRHAQGAGISTDDWDFFYRCYERTYLEHGNPPYLSRDFFHRMQRDMPEAWVLFIAERGGQAIASSLIAIGANPTCANSPKDPEPAVAFGRYWGALERVDCLHFEACYYQPIAWCIAHGVQRFEGGAQGEHKMARALLPVQATSAHWLAHPAFAEAVDRFLEREGDGMAQYLDHLQARSPFRKPQAPD
nr:GNAT family N-acetyltransferase [Paracidovorax wautersii]